MHPYLFIIFFNLPFTNEFYYLCVWIHFYVSLFSVLFCSSVLAHVESHAPPQDVCPCYHSDSHIVSFLRSWKDYLKNYTLFSNGCALKFQMLNPATYPLWTYPHPCRTVSHCTCILHIYFLYVIKFLYKKVKKL